MRHHPLKSLTICGGLLLGVALAVRPVRGQDSAAGLMRIRTRADESFSGRLQGVGDVLTVTTEDGRVLELPRHNLISARPTVGNRPVAEPESLVMLVNGDWLSGTCAALDDDSLQWQCDAVDDQSPVSIPLEFVRSVVISQPKEPVLRSNLRSQWAMLEHDADRVLYHNGTYADGEFTALDDTRLRLTTSIGPVESPREEVVALIMNGDLAAKPDRPLESVVLQTTDGSRVTLTSVVLAEDHVQGQLVCGTSLRVPLDRLLSLDFFSTHVVSPATLDPSEYRFTPYLTEQHPLVRNRNVYGGRLTLRGQPYATGLGMHSRSEVTYDLSGSDFTRFEATIGIDDLADGHGAVSFAVEVDGVVTFEAGDVRGRNDPLPVGPIDLTGAATLKLIVDFGRTGNILDIADWCNPLLIE